MGGIWDIHLHGFIIPLHQSPSADDIIVFGTLYLLIMTVSWLSNKEIEKSLTRARDSERALIEERDMLEIRVEERTNELRRIQLEEVSRIHRFAEFGQLASGLFHDLLNILNAISLRTEDHLEEESSLAAAYATTQQIQRFMRAVQEQLGKGSLRESFSLVEGTEQAIQLVTYKANKVNVRIAFTHDAPSRLIYEGVPFKLHQIIINLLTNAIDSYQGMAAASTSAQRTVTATARADENNFVITVQDGGCGIPEEVRDKIFEPFFTTKASSQGIGIGLATIKKVIEEDLRGTIEVRSESGKGSLFIVTFPKHYPLHELRRDP
jgi:two-component system C4-dicarboxylate transport sensor histidine kinase DctB